MPPSTVRRITSAHAARSLHSLTFPSLAALLALLRLLNRFASIHRYSPYPTSASSCGPFPIELHTYTKQVGEWLSRGPDRGVLMASTGLGITGRFN